MNIEREIKLLGIDTTAIHKLLRDNNVPLLQTLMFRRAVFDTVPTDENAWIRLRSDGTETTLCYKKTHSAEIDGTEEIEIVVDDFEKTQAILTAAGHVPRSFQENKRELYSWMDCQVTIDYWPRIEPYVEIEAEKQSAIEECLKKFEGLFSEVTTETTEKIYHRYGINLREINSLRMDDAS